MTELEYVWTRNMKVPRAQIEQMAHACGGSFFEDMRQENRAVLEALDRALKEYRATKGSYPDAINLREDPFFWYAPVPLTINIYGIDTEILHKPTYFRVPKRFARA